MPQCSRNNLVQVAAEQCCMTREANTLSRKTREHKPPPGKKRLLRKKFFDQRHNFKLRMRAKVFRAKICFSVKRQLRCHQSTIREWIYYNIVIGKSRLILILQQMHKMIKTGMGP